MDLKRITSALLGFPLVLAIFLIGNKYVVDVALAIITILAMNEYFNAISKVAKPVKWVRIFKLLKYSLNTYNTKFIFMANCNTCNTNSFINIICTYNCNRNENKF